MYQIIIAIDGYSSCGKSSTAKDVARHLGYTYIDTGAMYRACTLYFLDNHISLTNKSDINEALSKIQIDFRTSSKGQSNTYLNGLKIEDEIRSLRVANKVSEVSTIAEVRTAMVAQQRKMGKKKAIVMDGRDIGTVVFPDAELKVFMTADVNIRAHRRQKEILEKGKLITFDEVLANLQKRDLIDTTRDESPLRQAEDAYFMDTSHMMLDEQIEKVCLMADEAIAHKIHKGNA